MESPGLDGPLVQCTGCGLRYVGSRKSHLTFGETAPETAAEKIRRANLHIRHLRLEEEHRLALLNARWRLDLIRQHRTSGKLLEIGCARGEFLSVAREYFDVKGVEPNPDLARDASRVAPIHQDIIERTPWQDFDVISSFHVIEHVDSPSRFVAAAAARMKPDGLLVLETPDINSLPFRILRSKWRQFIPEHYFFFDRSTMEKLLVRNGLKVEKVMTVGKYASTEFLFNRLSRYLPWIPSGGRSSRLTLRINPMDIMLVFATRSQR